MRIHNNPAPGGSATLGAYFVAIYLFSVPAFSYSPDLSLAFIPQLLGFLVVSYAVVDIARQKNLQVGKDIQLYGLYSIWAVLTYLFSSLGGNFEQGGTLGTLVKVAAVTVAAAQLTKSRKDFNVVLAIYSSSIFLVAYLNYDLIQSLRNTTRILGTDRFDGTLANANTAAMYALSVIWTSLTIYLASSINRLLKYILMLSIPIAVWIIAFSGSKKGLLGVAILSVLISWILIKRHRKSFLKFSGAIIAAGVLLTGSVYYIYHSPFFFRLELFFTGGDTGSTAQRYYLAETAIRIWLGDVRTFLIGLGYDNFRFHNQLRTYSHSTVTETLVTTGIVGFLLYFSCLFILGKRLLKLQRIALYRDSMPSIYMGLAFVLLFVFFSINAVMCASREFWPLIALVSSYSMLFLARPTGILNKIPAYRIQGKPLPPMQRKAER